MENPICLSYVLTPEEIEAALIVSGQSGLKPKKSIFQSALLIGLFILFTVYAILDPTALQYFFFAALSLIFAPIPVILPRLTLKSRAKTAADGTTLEVKISPGRIDIEGFFQKWDIPLDEHRRVFESDKVFVAQAEENKLLCIPIRAVPPKELEQVRDILFI